MRVTESSLMSSLQTNVVTSSNAFQQTQQELATGKQLNEPSDNPLGTDQAMALQGMISDITQYQTNGASAKTFLSETDSQLSQVGTLITQARQIAVAASNSGSLTTDQESTYVTQLTNIITQISNLANGSVDGRQMFAGTATTTSPYSATDTTHAYAGNDGALTTEIAPDVSVQINTPGDQVFSTVFSSLETLKTDITSGNYTSVSNDIAGVDAGTNSVLQARANIGNVLDQISTTSDSLQTSSTSLTTQMSSIVDANLATTYTNMQAAQNVYQASLAATSKALQYSLVDYLPT